MGDRRGQYPRELRERAVRMVGEIRADHESEWAAMTRVAQLLGVKTPETVRQWVRQAEVDAGERAGTTTDESAEVKRLRRENAELKRANAILKAASLDSGSQRNEFLGGAVAQALAGSGVQPVGEDVKVRLGVQAQVAALG